MFQRILNPSKTRSFFIFGARGTGKSFFIEKQFLCGSHPETVWRIDLLDTDTEQHYARRPARLEEDFAVRDKRPEWVFIDEVQKVPALLDHVQRMITRQRQKFILTGSSARKLKRTGANLLAGRAFTEHMFPLTAAEMGGAFKLQECLEYGSLPEILCLPDPETKAKYLRSYAQVYVREEIQLEQVVRKIEPFRAFLEIAAQCNGQQTNFAAIGRQVDVDHKTVEQYFQVLEQTWLGFFLPAYHRSVRKAQAIHPKFYLFDPGVKRALERTLHVPLVPATSAYGEAFEHWVILEIFRLNRYHDLDYRLSFFRTKEGNEIDLILSRPGTPERLIEIKSTDRVDAESVARFARIASTFGKAHAFLLSRDPRPSRIHGVECLPWQEGLKRVL
ncbi:MAG: AAA family ATPase [Bdellovibrionota bacterium]